MLVEGKAVRERPRRPPGLCGHQVRDAGPAPAGRRRGFGRCPRPRWCWGWAGSGHTPVAAPCRARRARRSPAGRVARCTGCWRPRRPRSWRCSSSGPRLTGRTASSRTVGRICIGSGRPRRPSGGYGRCTTSTSGRCHGLVGSYRRPLPEWAEYRPKLQRARCRPSETGDAPER